MLVLVVALRIGAVEPPREIAILVDALDWITRQRFDDAGARDRRRCSPRRIRTVWPTRGVVDDGTLAPMAAPETYVRSPTERG